MEINANALLMCILCFCLQISVYVWVLLLEISPWQEGTVMKPVFFQSLQRCLMLITREKIIFNIQHRGYDVFLEYENTMFEK